MFDLTARSVGRVVARRAEAVGLQASGHSLRVGMAQEPGRFGRRLSGTMPGRSVAIPNDGQIRYTRSQAADRGAVARYYRHS